MSIWFKPLSGRGNDLVIRTNADRTEEEMLSTLKYHRVRDQIATQPWRLWSDIQADIEAGFAAHRTNFLCLIVETTSAFSLEPLILDLKAHATQGYTVRLGSIAAANGMVDGFDLADSNEHIHMALEASPGVFLAQMTWSEDRAVELAVMCRAHGAIGTGPLVRGKEHEISISRDTLNAAATYFIHAENRSPPPGILHVVCGTPSRIPIPAVRRRPVANAASDAGASGPVAPAGRKTRAKRRDKAGGSQTANKRRSTGPAGASSGQTPAGQDIETPAQEFCLDDLENIPSE